MWVAKHYKYKDGGLYLFNHLPHKVSDAENKRYYIIERFYREFDSWHGKIKLDEKFNYLFEGLEQPVEVNLVECDESEAMFYIQMHEDSKGFAHLYIDRALTTHHYVSKPPITDVDTYSGHRLPSTMFPELKEKGNYIPIKLEIVKK